MLPTTENIPSKAKFKQRIFVTTRICNSIQKLRASIKSLHSSRKDPTMSIGQAMSQNNVCVNNANKVSMPYLATRVSPGHLYMFGIC